MTARRAQWRAAVAGLTLAILGVLALDATTLVAATPETGAPARTAAGAPAAVPPPAEPLRTITWSGIKWLVFPSSMTAPRGDPVSDSARAVAVDRQGRLHLAITREQGVLKSAELVALWAPHYGRYRFDVHGTGAGMARSVVLGMFLFRSGTAHATNEIDLENSRSLYGIAPPHNAQFVVQPFNKPHHTRTYTLPGTPSHTVQEFTWTPGRVGFVTHANRPGGRLVNRFAYAGPDVPVPQGERLYINLWLTAKQVRHGTHSVVLDSFRFTPRA